LAEWFWTTLHAAWTLHSDFSSFVSVSTPFLKDGVKGQRFGLDEDIIAEVMK
jgi:hypothetical protein